MLRLNHGLGVPGRSFEEENTLMTETNNTRCNFNLTSKVDPLNAQLHVSAKAS